MKHRDDADRLRGLLHSDLEDCVEVELRANATTDLGDQPLALERRAQRLARPRPAEREGGLTGHALGRFHLRVRELPVRVLVDDDEHAGDLRPRR